MKIYIQIKIDTKKMDNKVKKNYVVPAGCSLRFSVGFKDEYDNDYALDADESLVVAVQAGAERYEGSALIADGRCSAVVTLPEIPVRLKGKWCYILYLVKGDSASVLLYGDVNYRGEYPLVEEAVAEVGQSLVLSESGVYLGVSQVAGSCSCSAVINEALYIDQSSVMTTGESGDKLYWKTAILDSRYISAGLLRSISIPFRPDVSTASIPVYLGVQTSEDGSTWTDVAMSTNCVDDVAGAVGCWEFADEVLPAGHLRVYAVTDSSDSYDDRTSVGGQSLAREEGDETSCLQGNGVLSVLLCCTVETHEVVAKYALAEELTEMTAELTGVAEELESHKGDTVSHLTELEHEGLTALLEGDAGSNWDENLFLMVFTVTPAESPGTMRTLAEANGFNISTLFPSSSYSTVPQLVLISGCTEFPSCITEMYESEVYNDAVYTIYKIPSSLLTFI